MIRFVRLFDLVPLVEPGELLRPGHEHLPLADRRDQLPFQDAELPFDREAGRIVRHFQEKFGTIPGTTGTRARRIEPLWTCTALEGLVRIAREVDPAQPVRW